jgi:RNA polymerase sigma-70 factor (ECF subfamily)
MMATPAVSEATLNRARSGDSAAFALLLGAHGGEIESFLYRLTANRHDAEDLAQEVWLRVHRGLSDFASRSSFRTWLFQIAVNVARDHHRARQRWPENTQDLAKDLAESGPETALEFRRVQREAAHNRFEISEHIDFCLTCIMKTLPLEQQLAVMLCEMYRFTNQQAAEVVGVSLGVLKHLLHDARHTLDQVFDRRCALINKSGICHQCTQLNGFFNPAQKDHEARAAHDLERAAADGRASLLDLRLELAAGINPLHATGTDLHDSIMQVCHKALALNSERA